ncbi:hypothetical protein IH824_13825 [candidate division KSB1 bacterium]|nr:hypothetical protein [candidate division KSB1 bacterium]
MKRNSLLHTFVFSIIILALSAQGFPQNTMTAEKWQEDVRYLQNLITTERSNLFHVISREEFEQAAEELHGQIPKMQRHEIIVGLSRLVAMFRIGHTNLPILPWRRNHDPNIGFHRFPLLVYLYPDGVYVQSAKEKYRDAVGARVVRLGNLRVRPLPDRILLDGS